MFDLLVTLWLQPRMRKVLMLRNTDAAQVSNWPT